MKRTHGVMGWMIVVVMATAMSAAAQSSDDAKHLLFYGNSFTMRHDVPASVARLAEAAGHPTPVVVRNLEGGKRMSWHLEQTRTHPENNIAAESVAGEQLDAVIFQGYSTEPTRIGNLQVFLDSTLALAKTVRESEAGQDAVFVLYQTWARGHGHSIYPDQFTEPTQMQQDLIEGYEAARQVLAQAFGEEDVLVAPVGATFASVNFEGGLYGRDNYHTGPMGSLLSAMIIYRTLYGGKIADLDPQAVAEARATEGWSELTDEQWNFAAKTADHCIIPRAAFQTATATP